MKQARAGRQLLLALLVSSMVSVFMYVILVFRYHDSTFWFLNWNLLLAWLPLGLSLWLLRYIRSNRWSSWQAITLTILWLAFLPNSFYIISDLMHINIISAYSFNVLFFSVMLFSFSINGLFLGFISLYIIHLQLIKRVQARAAHLLVAAILVLCSFAIYLGRYLRWSTWDIVLHPAGVVFDVSDRIINPTVYGQTFLVTLMFFVLLSSMYLVIWNLVQAGREYKAG